MEKERKKRLRREATGEERKGEGRRILFSLSRFLIVSLPSIRRNLTQHHVEHGDSMLRDHPVDLSLDMPRYSQEGLSDNWKMLARGSLRILISWCERESNISKVLGDETGGS